MGKGIQMEFCKIYLLSNIEIGAEDDEEAPVVEINLKIGNVKGMGSVEKKSVISGKLHQ